MKEEKDISIEARLDEQWKLIGEYRGLFETMDVKIHQIMKKLSETNTCCEATKMRLPEIDDIYAKIDEVDAARKLEKRSTDGLVEHQEKRLDAVKSSVADFASKFSDISTKIALLDTRVSSHVDGVRELSVIFDNSDKFVKSELKQLSDVVNFNKTTADEYVNGVKDAVLSRFETIYADVKKMLSAANIDEIKKSQRHIHDDVDSLSQRLSIMEAQIENVLRQANKLDLAIKAIKVGK